MTKTHASVLLVASALALGSLLTWMALDKVMPDGTLPEPQKNSTAASLQPVTETSFTAAAPQLGSSAVAPPQTRGSENSPPASPVSSHNKQGAYRPEPRFTESEDRTSAPAWPTGRPEFMTASSAAKTAPSASVALSAPASVVVDQDIPVPRGEALPAAIMDVGHGASAAQVQGLDDIAGEFLDNALAPGSPNQAGIQNWRDATRLADQRYRSMFGVEAFNRWSIEAAKEALAEKSQR